MRTKILAALIGVVVTVGAYGQNTNTSDKAVQAQQVEQTQDAAAKVKLTDADFVEKANLAGLTQVAVAQVGLAKLDKTHAAKLRKFSQSIFDQQTDIGNQLKQLAAANRLPLPGQLDKAHSEQVNQLKPLTGDAFKAAYIAQIKQNLDTMVGLFDNAAAEPTLNVQLRVFANKTLVVLRAQQKHAHALVDTTHLVPSTK